MYSIQHGEELLDGLAARVCGPGDCEAHVWAAPPPLPCPPLSGDRPGIDDDFDDDWMAGDLDLE